LGKGGICTWGCGGESPFPNTLGAWVIDILAIVGLSKNAGKTTFLNWYLSTLDKHNYPVGVTTTGRDGEDIDLLTAQKKPKVILPKDVYFTSFASVSQKHQSDIEIIKKLPFRVIGQHLWLYKTTSPIQTEVVGPTTLTEQDELINIFMELHCQTILIDGSIDRKSIGLSENITDIALVIGAAKGNLEDITRTAQLYKLYSQIPHKHVLKYENITSYTNNTIMDSDVKSIYTNESTIIDILSQQPQWIYIPGAITLQSWIKLKATFINFTGDIIFKSPININIPPMDIENLISKHKIYTSTPFPLKMIAVNSYSPTNEHLDAVVLREQVKMMFPEVAVVDVMGVRCKV